MYAPLFYVPGNLFVPPLLELAQTRLVILGR